MKRKIKLSQGIQYIMIFLAVTLFLSIWPAGLIQKKEVIKSKEQQLRESGAICVESNGTQRFMAKGSCLKAVDLYVLNDMSSQTITFRLYDENYIQLWETFHIVDEKAEFPGFVHIPIDMETEAGKEYHYTVEGLTKNMFLAYEDTAASGTDANLTYKYGGVEQSGINIIIRYTYATPFSWWATILLGMIICLVCGIFMKFISLLENKFHVWEKKITVQQLLQATLNPIIIATALLLLIMVFPGRVFGVGIINYGFYYLGIILAAAVLIIIVNYERRGGENFSPIHLLKEKLPLWGMSVCFAGALWSCYEYMNGLYDIHHSYAACKFLTWLAFGMIFTFKKKNVLSYWNILYIIPAVAASYFYVKPMLGVPEQEELYRLQARFLIVAGFLLLQIVISLAGLIRQKEKLHVKINIPYVTFLVIWMITMVLFRYNRDWVIVLSVTGLILYYCMWRWDKRDLLLSIYSNGIILNFVYTVSYCLLHRPYLRFRHNRYGMVYHTVTMTGYYLSLVLCAIMVRLMVQYRRTRRIHDCWLELSLLGIGNVYLFLTLSRTGYLAAFVMQLFIVVIQSIIFEKEKLKSIGKNFLMMISVTFIFFPIVFTAQRIVPALANDPIYSEIEVWDYVVEKGDPKDSELYIDVVAFFKVAGNKLFGIDMGNISLSKNENGINKVLYVEDLQKEESVLVRNKVKYYFDLAFKNPVSENFTFVKDNQRYKNLIYIKKDDYLLASEAEMYEEEDISNGRFEIFTSYMAHWNMTGHEEMGVPLPDGEVAIHAHNTFLQYIHDHGLISGIIFILFGVISFIIAIIRYSQEGEKSAYLLLTLAILCAFAVAGMVEWIFHLCNPFGISLLVAISPLLFKTGNKS